MKDNKSNSFFHKMATFIVDKRNLFFLLYLFAFVFCIFSMSWVEVENDVTTYLPEATETRQGIVAMNENFATIATARVMVSNITYETAEELFEDLSSIDGIAMVSFGDTAENYTSASALYDVTFTGGNFDESSLQALDEIRELLANYDIALYTEVGFDQNAMLDDEMLVILIVAVVLILVVLTLTSRAYMEVPVLLITFGAAALLNMGTSI